MSFQLSEADYQDFLNWLESKDVSYQTNTEAALSDFKEIAQKESYFDGIQKEYETLQKSVAKDKKQDLVKHKNEVKQLLQEEIVSRYFFLRGRLQNQMSTDAEVNEALNVLADMSRYNKILGKQ
jgi:carboxyl-terminal processing protease